MQYYNVLLCCSSHSYLEKHQTYVQRSNFLLDILFLKKLQTITYTSTALRTCKPDLVIKSSTNNRIEKVVHT